MADNKPSPQFKLWCVPNIDGKNVLMRKRKSAETKKWHIRLENGINIDSKLLWKQVKYALNLQDNVNIPDIVYCIMSYEAKVHDSTNMKTFLKLLVQGAFHTGALIITSGLCRGITKLLCKVIEEETKNYDGFCLKKEIYMIAIIAESQIVGWTPCFQTDETTQEPYVTYIYGEDENTMVTECTLAPFEIRHRLFILVEKGNLTDKENLTRTSQVALGLVEHLKNTYTDGAFIVPKGGNEEREFHWYCDGCRSRILGKVYHCQECGDFDLCYVCFGDSDKWPDGHSTNHDSQCDSQFDTWKPDLQSLGLSRFSWRCTSCHKHIWDKIYVRQPCRHITKSHDILCVNCHKWEACTSWSYKEIELEPAD